MNVGVLSKLGVGALLSAFFLGGTSALAQAPTLGQPFPMGVQRGTTLDLNLTGANLAEPTGVLVNFPAKVTIPTENNNGKDNAKLLVRLEVPKDAPLGWHSLRVATTRGVSNFRLFCIDDLPQVLEQDNNRSLATAQAVPVPCIVCGRADPEITDYFKFTAQAGQRLSFELLGRRLGSNLDPQISLLDPRNGRQLAFSDDAPGQNKDPRMTYTFKEGGEYAIELRDVRYQGGTDWYYRLRIGDFPCATTPIPLAVKRGTTTAVQFAGPQVEGVLPVAVAVFGEPKGDTVWLTPVRPDAPCGWPVPLAVSDLEESLEVEPNDQPAQANRVPVPGAVSGRFEKKGELDHYVFAAKKGQRYQIDALTQELQSPTTMYLVLKDAKGAQLAASNPANDPTRIDYTAKEDGDLTLAVEHLLYAGGPDQTYRLTILPPEPGFTLTATADRFDVPQGVAALVPLQVTRRNYNGPIEVTVTSPPGVSGTATVPAGQNGAMLLVTAEPAAKLAGHSLTLVGKAAINDKVVAERAEVKAVVSQALGNLPFPPAHLTGELAVAVTEKPPFTLQATFAYPEGVRGQAVPVTITATKQAGFDEEITITTVVLPVPQGQQAAIPAVNAKIPKGQTEVKVELKPAEKAPLGVVPLAFTGKAKQMNRESTVHAQITGVTLALPFDLQVEAGDGKLAPEEKLKVKVKAVRKGGYKGPINLEVRNLPANVTAAKATIAENQDEAEIELSAAADAALGEKKDVNIQGTATAANSQQNVSPNFTINVMKESP
jgi:hypothetical protein